MNYLYKLNNKYSKQELEEEQKSNKKENFIKENNELNIKKGNNMKNEESLIY